MRAFLNVHRTRTQGWHVSRQRSESDAPGNEAAEFDRFSDVFMEFLFEHGHLSKSFRPWWQSRKRAVAAQGASQALRTIRSICKDHLEMTRHWATPEVAMLDSYLENAGALTLSTMRRRLWHSPTTPTSMISTHRRPSPY